MNDGSNTAMSKSSPDHHITAVSARQARMMLLGFIVFLGLVYLLRDILPPFLAGMAVAYFLDPVADRLEKAGLSRTLSTSIITLCFFGILTALLFMLVPLLQSQVMGFVARMPDYVKELEALAEPWVAELKSRISADQIQQLGDAAGSYAGDAIKWLGSVIKSVLSGGVAVFSLISLVVIMPVVSFYMLRDWDLIVARLDDLLPRRHQGDIRQIVRDIDRTLAGFVRGQSSVCLLLGTFYGIGLSLAGLEFGLVVGLATGILSFIPYVGMALGLIVGFGIALVQFGNDLMALGIIAGVFATGQLLESFVLTPKLVGGSVGLHPVWIIFALMAGGALFGFAGVLLAVPLAAIIGVLVRFFAECYLASEFYSTGGDGEAGGGKD